MGLLQQVVMSLRMAFYMFWEVLWPLILGFTLSALVQAVVSHKTMAKTLGKNTTKSATLAALFGIASSSCSYAAIALARSIFQKGASFANAMIFEIASTNLVIELGIILFVIMGWQFAVAEWLGGIFMVILLALVFRITLTKQLVEQARKQAGKGLQGKMEGHAAMDMSIAGNTSFGKKLLSQNGFTAISHFFVMDWVSIWIDLLIGFLVAGVLTVFVPESFWQAFFFAHNKLLSFIVGPLVGPLIAIISFVCSVGNVPLAAVLWKGGISFGGVVSFIFADLIILPILDIYRKYYGWKVAVYIFVTFYATMAAAGYLIELLFSALRIIPSDKEVTLLTSGISWNYTSVLNIIFLVLAALLVIRFVTTGGPAMLRMMNMSHHDMDHGHHH
jgi:uncharacterized membrane protein YraQ (UPF0718 family)